GDGSIRQQRRQADKPSIDIRQQEGRHRLARPWRVVAAAVLVDALDQTVDRIAVGRKDFAPRRGIGLELLAERAFHVAASQESLPQALGIGWRKRVHGWLRLMLMLVSLTGRPQELPPGLFRSEDGSKAASNAVAQSVR